MYLKRLYCEPDGLFKEVVFKDGINFVFGKKDQNTDPKGSLNGIGKSLLLDLIDFCLLSSYDENNNRRLYKAKQLMLEYTIALDFEVNGKLYTIKRNVINPNKIEFASENIFETYQLRDLQRLLCDLIFENKKYQGNYENKWLRKLISFFIKIERYKKEKFVDPIHYIKEAKLTELNQFHLFLMGINNKLIYENYLVQEELKKKETALSEVRKLLEVTYNLKNTSEANSKIEICKREINDFEVLISKFKLQKQYEDVELQANDLTRRIKELNLLNYNDRIRLEAYKESCKLDVSVNPIKISHLYKEFNKDLAISVEKTLKEVIEFREKLTKSRKEFLSEEIMNLEVIIENRKKQILELDNERAELFTFLSNQHAINDLSEAYLALNKKRETLNEIEGKIRIYNDLNDQKLDYKNKDSVLARKIFAFRNEIELQISDFRRIFLWLYNSIYAVKNKHPNFSLDFDENTNAKIKIQVDVPAVCSEGNNRGRTLLYDLSILINAIDIDIKCPRFLIHDGIFNGMDRTHFVQLYEFLEQLKETKRFQYIVTLNEEGTLNESFGNIDQITTQKISDTAIRVLTPSHKLFGKDYDDT